MMMTNNLFKQKPWGNTLALAAGLTAVAGIAVICAIPRTRKACGRWISNAVDGLKERISGNSNGGPDWKQDMMQAEALKGPLKKRKDPAKVEVPSAGTSAWKDEWHSE